MKRTLLICALVLFAAIAPRAEAANIIIINLDSPGEGFNDPTAVAPVGGNPGITIGEQRLNVFQEAADIWGALLPSAVTIRVEARFNPQSCDSSSAVLGSAGPVTVIRDFAGAELTGTWYHIALASKLAGTDLSGSNDISATFNSSIDNNDACLTGTNWYYGLDGNEGGDVELLPVVLHELGHGLGFSTLVGSTGLEFQGVQDLYETFILDNTTGLTWDQMTNNQRSTSAVNTGNVVWSGPASTLASPRFLGGVPTMFVNSPPALPATIPLGTAAFGPAVDEIGVTGNVVLADDGVGVTSDACSALINGAAISGNIALIDRGSCTFVSKALAAQSAGAIAVIIANNVADPDPISLGGTDPSVTIPVVSITLSDGDAIKAQLGTGVNVTLALDPSNLAGADSNNRVKLYTPNPYEGGSSVSHWDVSANPSLLMEPAITGNLSNEVDLTLGHFTDLGWIDDCLQVACPSDTTVDANTVLDLDFCVTNCAFDDSLTITVTDTEGWCTPVSQVTPVIAGDSLCVPVSCSIPDSCDGPPNVVTFQVETSGGTVESCTTTITVDCGSVTSVGDPGPRGPAVLLASISPTPFSAAAEIRFNLPEADRVQVDVFDFRGRRVRSILSGEERPLGEHSIGWDGRNERGAVVAAGIYFVRVATDNHGSRVVRAVRLSR